MMMSARPAPGSTLVMLTLSGALNPVHCGHVEMMHVAAEALRAASHTVIAGLLAPSSESYLNNKLGAEALSLAESLARPPSMRGTSPGGSTAAASVVGTIRDKYKNAVSEAQGRQREAADFDKQDEKDFLSELPISEQLASEMAEMQAEMDAVEDKIFAKFSKALGVASVREYEERSIKVAREREAKLLALKTTQSKLKAQLLYEKRRDMPAASRRGGSSGERTPSRVASCGSGVGVGASLQHRHARRAPCWLY